MFHDPNCEVCKLTKTKRTRCKNRPLKRADGISLPTTFGELTIADRKVLNLDDGSRNDHQHAVIVQDGYSHLLQSNPTKSTTAQETASCSRRLLPPFQKPARVSTDNSKEFIKACQDLQWTHDTNATYRWEANGILEEPSVRRVKKGTATAMVQEAFPMNGGTLRWNVIATCATCMTRWPMARQSMKTHLV